MGITIHYQGKINELSLIDNFIDELTDISNELEWKNHIIDDNELNIKGIMISPPPECELLTFLFDKTTGIIKDRIILAFDDMGDDHYKYNHTKTQFAPINVHITIIKLLKYLQGKYISDLAVTDEGEYWETNNAELLQTKFDFLDEMINLITDSLNKTQKKPGESVESLAERIEKILAEIHERNRNKYG